MDKIIEKACRFINAGEKIPSLKQVADYVGYTPSHFQRLFKEALGISPRSFADAKRRNQFRDALQKGSSITQALYDAGYGSSSRVYEFALQHLGMTPKKYRKGGAGQTIWFTIVDCFLGKMLIAATAKGICAVIIDNNEKKMRAELSRIFNEAMLIESAPVLKEWTQALIDYLSGKTPWPVLPYDIQATAFQKKVWDRLRTIPPGKTYHYEEVAKAIGKPKAARAVARACATNPAALVIPCHRIVPKAGGIGGYRWSSQRKKKLLELESGH